MRKNSKSSIAGFVLVEVIVVAVIVGILAAISIPVYNGYVKNQKLQAASAIAQAGATSANIFFRRTGLSPTPEQLNLFISDPSRYNVAVTGDSVFVTDNTDGSTPPIKGAAKFK